MPSNTSTQLHTALQHFWRELTAEPWCAKTGVDPFLAPILVHEWRQIAVCELIIVFPAPCNRRVTKNNKLIWIFGNYYHSARSYIYIMTKFLESLQTAIAAHFPSQKVIVRSIAIENSHGNNDFNSSAIGYHMSGWISTCFHKYFLGKTSNYHTRNDIWRCLCGQYEKLLQFSISRLVRKFLLLQFLISTSSSDVWLTCLK